MKIGILVLFVNSYGKKGFYNSQEIGMAKEFAARGHQVKIFKCVGVSQERVEEKISDNVIYHLEPVRNLGNNALTDFEWIDKDLDVIISCSDIQLMTGRAYKWARNNSILFLPYIGVAHSNSSSALKRFISNMLSAGTIRTIRKSGAIAKTNGVKSELMAKGVKDITAANVGIDFDLLKSDYKVDKDELLSELSLSSNQKYVLLVGRLSSDRCPLDSVPVLEKLVSEDQDINMIVIGQGPLKPALEQELHSHNLSDNVIWIDQVPNSEMWKYYRVAEALISFNKDEIFGMSLLEAMYYELPVFAVHAPGPDDIIINGKTGFLYKDSSEMSEMITLSGDNNVGIAAHQSVVERFTWKTFANAVEEKVRSFKNVGGNRR